MNKIKYISTKHDYILSNLYFPSNEKKKINDYYIGGKLINKIYIQLRGIFAFYAIKKFNFFLIILREKLIQLK